MQYTDEHRELMNFRTMLMAVPDPVWDSISELLDRKDITEDSKNFGPALKRRIKVIAEKHEVPVEYLNKILQWAAHPTSHCVIVYAYDFRLAGNEGNGCFDYVTSARTPGGRTTVIGFFTEIGALINMPGNLSDSQKAHLLRILDHVLLMELKEFDTTALDLAKKELVDFVDPHNGYLP